MRLKGREARLQLEVKFGWAATEITKKVVRSFEDYAHVLKEGREARPWLKLGRREGKLDLSWKLKRKEGKLDLGWKLKRREGKGERQRRPLITEISEFLRTGCALQCEVDLVGALAAFKF